MSTSRPSTAPAVNPPPLQHVAELLTRLSDRLSADPGGSLAQSVVEAALELVPATRWCSITVEQNGRFRSLVATDDVALRIDAFQYEIGSGPCLDAIRQDTVLVCGDLANDPRWPRYAEAACAVGVRSVLAHRLNILGERRTVAGLNLYSDEVDGFDEESRWTSTMLATHAALGVSLELTRDRAENLQAALRSNREIGMAIGVLMGRHSVTQDQAFDLLRLASQHTNRKVADIAGDVILTGQLPRSLEPKPRRTVPDGEPGQAH